MSRLLVGLGNPGLRYQGTRHNVGFEALDRILSAASGHWSRATERAIEAEAQIEGRPVTLMKPLTYMNLSGEPVAEWVLRHSIARSEVLVYIDDVALPLGSLRLRQQGSDGGHRGLASVLEALGGTDVPRVRIGIHPGDGTGDLAQFVLSPFTAEERRIVDEVLDRVVAATRTVLAEGMVQAMSRYNTATA